MELLLHKVNLFSLGLGCLVWLAVLVLICWPRKPKPKGSPVGSYLSWHKVTRLSYQEYITSGEGGGRPPTKVEATIAATAFALLILVVSLGLWGAIR